MDKFTKLLAACDRFFGSIASLDDPRAMLEVKNRAEIRAHYAPPLLGPRSALAAGMGQGLREKPGSFGSMSAEAGRAAQAALSAAIAAHYPEFLARDAERLSKIMARSPIRSANDYDLVRYHVDLRARLRAQG